MANRMVYVRKNDETFWERGALLAEGMGMSMSEYVAYLLRREVLHEQMRRGQKKTPGEILDDMEALQKQLRAVLDEEASDG